MSGPSAWKPAKSDSFVLIPKHLRLEWLDVMATDSRLSNAAFRIGAVIGYHFNKKTGQAFLTQELIAKILDISERSAFSATKELEKRGYLIIKRREFGTVTRKTKTGQVEVRIAGGKGVANTYFPAFERSRVSANERGLKLAERCDLVWEQRSQKSVAKVAANCDPTLSPPTEENPMCPSEPKREDDHLGRVGEVIRRAMGDEVYRAWFGKVRILEETSTMLILAAPSKFVCSRIKQDYEHRFASWCQALGKEKLEITDVLSPAYAERIARQRKVSS